MQRAFTCLPETERIFKMPIYVAEIAGRATFAFNADSEDHANGHLSENSFLSDLYVLQSGGRSLWNGKSEIRLRAALANEAALWEAAERCCRSTGVVAFAGIPHTGCRSAETR